MFVLSTTNPRRTDILRSNITSPLLNTQRTSPACLHIWPNHQCRDGNPGQSGNCKVSHHTIRFPTDILHIWCASTHPNSILQAPSTLHALQMSAGPPFLPNGRHSPAIHPPHSSNECGALFSPTGLHLRRTPPPHSSNERRVFSTHWHLPTHLWLFKRAWRLFSTHWHLPTSTYPPPPAHLWLFKGAQRLVSTHQPPLALTKSREYVYTQPPHNASMHLYSLY
jgi:hypothetical protein